MGLLATHWLVRPAERASAAQLVAVVIFAVRIWPAALRASWRGADPTRHFAIGSFWAVAALVLFMYIVRRGTPGWVPHVVFWGVNLGLAVFVAGLLVDTAEIKRIGAPVMGLTLLEALGLLATRLLSRPLDDPDATPA